MLLIGLIVSLQGELRIGQAEGIEGGKFECQSLSYTVASSALVISGESQISKSCLSNLSYKGVKKVAVLPGVTSVGSEAFKGWMDLEEIFLPDTVLSVGNSKLRIFQGLQCCCAMSPEQT
jgi:hypothetical protein